MGSIKQLYCSKGNTFFTKLLEIQILQILLIPNRIRYLAPIPVTMKIHETYKNGGGYSFIQQPIGHRDH